MLTCRAPSASSRATSADWSAGRRSRWSRFLTVLPSGKDSCFKVPSSPGRTCDHDRERHRHQAGNHGDRAGCRALRRSIVEKLLLLWCWIAYAIAAKVLPRGWGAHMANWVWRISRYDFEHSWRDLSDVLGCSRDLVSWARQGGVPHGQRFLRSEERRVGEE